VVQTEIDERIWDKNDDSNLGVVYYSPWSTEQHDTVITAATEPPDGETPPKSFNLSQNHPNPFNPTTTINYDLPVTAQVTLQVYDVSGRLVRTLVDGNVLDAGRKRIVWDGRDDFGNQVSSGIYFYRISAADYQQTRKMVLIR
jgi:hypothetical protein